MKRHNFMQREEIEMKKVKVGAVLVAAALAAVLATGCSSKKDESKAASE